MLTKKGLQIKTDKAFYLTISQCKQRKRKWPYADEGGRRTKADFELVRANSVLRSLSQ